MVLLASVKVIMFSTVPLGAVIGCERARAGHTQQHCLQTPGRDDVTLHEHMFPGVRARVSLYAFTCLKN